MFLCFERLCWLRGFEKFSVMTGLYHLSWSSSFIHAVACVGSLFLFTAEWYFIAQAGHTLSFHSSPDQRVSDFCLFSVASHAALNISVRVSDMCVRCKDKIRICRRWEGSCNKRSSQKSLSTGEAAAYYSWAGRVCVAGTPGVMYLLQQGHSEEGCRMEGRH